MEPCRKFHITLRSAEGLENVRGRSRMKVYAKLKVAGDSRTKKKTPVDKEGGTSPAWNFDTGFMIGNRAVEDQGVILVIKLYCSKTLKDQYIGEVSVSLKDLFDHAGANRSGCHVSFPVKRGAADSQGCLNFSYSFGDIELVGKPSVRSRNWLFSGGMLILKVVTQGILGGPVLDILFSALNEGSQRLIGL